MNEPTINRRQFFMAAAAALLSVFKVPKSIARNVDDGEVILHRTRRSDRLRLRVIDPSINRRQGRNYPIYRTAEELKALRAFCRRYGSLQKVQSYCVCWITGSKEYQPEEIR